MSVSDLRGAKGAVISREKVRVREQRAYKLYDATQWEGLTEGRSCCVWFMLDVGDAPPPMPPTAPRWRRGMTPPTPCGVVISEGIDKAGKLRVLSLQPGESKRVVLPPGDYWQKASCPTAPFVRPFFGEMTVGVGTYRQTFIVVSHPGE